VKNMRSKSSTHVRFSENLASENKFREINLQLRPTSRTKYVRTKSVGQRTGGH
jgi:hypothetical protein